VGFRHSSHTSDLSRSAATLSGLPCVGSPFAHPPGDWLTKAYHEDRLVDVLYRLGGVRVSKQLLGRAEELRIESVLMRPAL
jgi:hypothetical protein